MFICVVGGVVELEGRLQEMLSLYVMGPGDAIKVIRLGSWFLSR